MIQVTEPFLPPQKDYLKYIESIWDRNWLTNNGPLVQELELRLREYLNINQLCYVSNGTIALQIAIKALDLKGEIITTPFSYVATTSSIIWEGCKPVFVDIDKGSLNIDPTKIESAITNDTSAILATHVYGNPCDIEALEDISRKHNLKVIYDAAHAFGVKYKERSIFEYGDISTASFHATKIFHTIEGGAIITNNAALLKRVSYMRNFGHDGPGKFNGVGINGKNSEFHAAMGLCNLKYVDQILEKRKHLSLYYDQCLKNLNVQRPRIHNMESYNYAYYPIIFSSEDELIRSVDLLNSHQIYPRRYFYPALSNLDYIQSEPMSQATSIARRVICLPMYDNLNKEEIRLIANLLLNA